MAGLLCILGGTRRELLADVGMNPLSSRRMSGSSLQIKAGRSEKLLKNERICGMICKAVYSEEWTDIVGKRIVL